MKTASANLIAHHNQTVTTLASVWQILRMDGVEFYFTDHPKNIVYDGDTYKAATGFDRSAIESKSDLSVDNLDVTCLMDDDAITETDLRAGMFDHANVQIGDINYESTADGVLWHTCGRLGEVSISSGGIFKAELMGLGAALGQNITTIYQAECRANLGDAKCKIPIQPDLIARNTALTLGDFYRVNTLSPIFPRVWDNLLQNPSFEMGVVGVNINEQLTGWEIASGISFVRWKVFSGISADEYDYLVFGGIVTYGNGDVYQSVDLLAAGLDADEIDAGNAQIDTFSIRRGNTDTSEGRVEVDYLDVDSALISNAYDSGWEAIASPPSWATRSDTSIAIPTLTRYIRVTLGKRWVSGAFIGSCFDACQLTVSCGTNVEYSGQRLNENRIYEVTTAGVTHATTQPTYDKTIGNPTTDGSAVLTCRNAWMRVAEVETVIDQSNFTVRVNEARAEPAGAGETEWFSGGAIVFETGLKNLYRAYEIKSWTVITEVDANNMIGQIELFRPLSDAISPGQQARLYVGCDYRFDTCINRFDNVENFRGEPHIPGTDSLRIIKGTA